MVILLTCFMKFDAMKILNIMFYRYSVGHTRISALFSASQISLFSVLIEFFSIAQLMSDQSATIFVWRRC